MVALVTVLLLGGCGDQAARLPGIAGEPRPQLGTALVGDGGLLGAVDAYGQLTDLYWPRPGASAQIDHPAKEGASVAGPDTLGIAIAVGEPGRRPKPLRQGRAVKQVYVEGSTVLETRARAAAGRRASVTDAVADDGVIVRRVRAGAAVPIEVTLTVNFDLGGNAAGDTIETAPGGFVQVDGRFAVACTSSGGALRWRVLATGGDARAVLSARSGTRSGGASVTLYCAFAPGRADAAGAAERARESGATRLFADRMRADHKWLAAARMPRVLARPRDALARRARALYLRSLLVLRQLGGVGGAPIAGARDFWDYVWPRDASVAAIALAKAGYLGEARRVVQFLVGRGPNWAARYFAGGQPVRDGRAPAGDAFGFVAAAAAEVAGRARSSRPAMRAYAELTPAGDYAWRTLDGDQLIPDRREDYWEHDPGPLLANAIATAGGFGSLARLARKAELPAEAERRWSVRARLATAALDRAFYAPGAGYLRVARAQDSGRDAALGWAVAPFELGLPRARTVASMEALVRGSASTRFGLLPGDRWGERDPWMAETAQAAWALARLGKRDQARRSIRQLLDMSGSTGLLPERVDGDTGIPTSTTPLAWAHAATVLALDEIYG